jgi:hypothetical protein
MIATVDVPYEIDEDVVITVQDSRLAGNCNKGVRAEFRRRGWDWADFVENGRRTGDFGVFDSHVREAYESAVRRAGG